MSWNKIHWFTKLRVFPLRRLLQQKVITLIVNFVWTPFPMEKFTNLCREIVNFAWLKSPIFEKLSLIENVIFFLNRKCNFASWESINFSVTAKLRPSLLSKRNANMLPICTSVYINWWAIKSDSRCFISLPNQPHQCCWMNVRFTDFKTFTLATLQINAYQWSFKQCWMVENTSDHIVIPDVKWTNFIVNYFVIVNVQIWSITSKKSHKRLYYLCSFDV